MATVLRVEGVPLNLGLALIRAGRRDLAVRLVEDAWRTAPTAVTGLAIALAPKVRPDILMDEKVRLEAVLRALVAEADPELRAARSYNLATWLRSCRDLSAARSAFADALDLDTSNEAWPYFWRDYGNVLFELGAFREAADAYGRAVAQGAGDALGYSLYGDALLWSGEYASSRAELDRALGLDGQRSLAKLGFVTADLVLEFLPATRQERRPDEARVIQSALERGDAEETVETFHELLSLDALSPAAWELAWRLSAAGGHPRPEFCIAAAFADRHSLRLWIYAVAASLDEDPESGLLDAVIDFGDVLWGDELEKELQLVAGDSSAEFGARLTRVRSTVARVRGRRTPDRLVLHTRGARTPDVEL
jgi:tetratricopeptide (TPR) repeat protein